MSHIFSPCPSWIAPHHLHRREDSRWSLSTFGYAVYYEDQLGKLAAEIRMYSLFPLPLILQKKGVHIILSWNMAVYVTVCFFGLYSFYWPQNPLAA